MAIEQFELKLNWTKMLTPNVLHLAFSRADGKVLPFIPGQFLTFVLPVGDKVARRSYSIASQDPHWAEIEIAVSPIEKGIATDILFALKPGESLTTTGPFGRLILPNDNYPQKIVLAATGTGVSPYRAMLPQIHNLLIQNPDLELTLLLGVQYRKDLLYGEDFIAFAKTHPSFQFRAYLSREEKLTESHEYKGHLQQAFKELNLNSDEDLIYLCGNPNMIDEAFAQLLEAGFPTPHIKREKYLSSGTSKS
jgi:ferredoxin-NADP reductase